MNTIKEQTITINESYYKIKYEIFEYYIQFEVFKYDIENKLIEIEHDLILEGYIKWDRCSNWTLGKEIMFHCCELKDFIIPGILMSKCYTITIEELPTFDKSSNP